MKTRFLILFAAVAVMVCGCKKASYLNVDRDKVSLARQGASDSIILRSDASHFQIATAPEWVKTELKDTVLYLSVDANPGNSARKGNIVISDDDQRLSVAVIQAGVASYLTLGSSNITIPQDGSDVHLKVDTDGGDVRLEGVEGVKATYADGVMTFTSNGNPDASRSTKGRIVCDTISRTITVLEKGEVCGRCGGKGSMVCSHCSGEGVVFIPFRTCFTCKGRGRVTCPECHGKGK